MSTPQSISLWMDQMAEHIRPRPALTGDLQVDIAIIGAGYTGLWTAYYLKKANPALSIAILEAQTVGYGASGRNGGWLIGELAGEDRLLNALSPQARQNSRRLLQEIPDEVARVTTREGIDCDYRKAGGLYCAARYPEQAVRLRGQLKDWHHHGHTEDDYRWLDPMELSQQLQLATPYGAVRFAHIATIHPAKLVLGLANCIERLGVSIYEHSPASRLEQGQARTAGGTVRANWIIPAVEGYASTLPPLQRYQMAVQSMMIATEPLSDAIWQKIGLNQGQAFSENSRLVSYGQRTADNRMVFGSRGGYRFGGKLRSDMALGAAEIAERRQLLTELFPVLADARITHSWGGNLGVARRFRPHMVCDRQRRIAWAGGYGGEGVGACNLAGRTLADLVLEQDSELVHQPWVRQSGMPARWEPEPLRWLGYTAIGKSFEWEDHLLNRPGTPDFLRSCTQKWAAAMDKLMQ
jgi:glycine/D-amino acid oxidase-like deaminating enzyme